MCFLLFEKKFWGVRVGVEVWVGFWFIFFYFVVCVGIRGYLIICFLEEVFRGGRGWKEVILGGCYFGFLFLLSELFIVWLGLCVLEVFLFGFCGVNIGFLGWKDG